MDTFLNGWHVQKDQLYDPNVTRIEQPETVVDQVKQELNRKIENSQKHMEQNLN